MSERATAVIVGAGSGVGRALAGALARRGMDLVLTSRDARDLEATAADCAVRCGARAHAEPFDLLAAPEAFDGYTARCRERLGRVDHLLVTAGMISDEDDGVSSAELTDMLWTVNYRAVVRLVSAFLPMIEAQGRGTIVLFSSIAAAAPRRRNVIYGSAKRALEGYGRSLQHRFADTAIRVQIWAPGYVDTAMTFGRRLLLPVASAEALAACVARNMDRDVRFRYYPRFWRLVVAVLRSLPWPVYKRLSF